MSHGILKKRESKSESMRLVRKIRSADEIARLGNV